MLVEQIMLDGIDVLEPGPGRRPRRLYQRANAHFKADPEFADRARRRVVALQAGDEETRQIWRQLLDISLAGVQRRVRPARACC